MSARKIFRNLLTPEEAWNKLLEHYEPKSVGEELVLLRDAYGRILAEDIVSEIDVPSFDRASMDGFAVKAVDTFGAEEDRPRKLKVIGFVETGDTPSYEVTPGAAVEIGTGAAMPRGGNAVAMVEYTERRSDEILIYKPVTPGENVLSTGSDIMAGELVLRNGSRITPREMGVLAATGKASIKVLRKPRVAILSTGNELVNPGEQLGDAKIYDINAHSIFGSVVESGGEPLFLGVARDEQYGMEEKLRQAFKEADCVLTSGSTSAGVGDLIYRVVDRIGKPGVIVHGLSIKPGKPAIVAVVNGKPFFGLPGYPSSALMIYNILADRAIRMMSGLPIEKSEVIVKAKVAQKIFSTKGRREFLPVHLVSDDRGELRVYPILSGSGAISSFAMADGFIEIPEAVAFISEDDETDVQLLSRSISPADLVIIGSHCVGLDILLSIIRKTHKEFSAKVINAGSIGGLHAIKRGEADIAGIHLVDEKTRQYNVPFVIQYDLSNDAVMIRGYEREQGLILRTGNSKRIKSFSDIIEKKAVFINRNIGSGTRILTDLYFSKLAERKGTNLEQLSGMILGYDVEAKSHSAVASSVKNGRAEVGVGIKTVANQYGLNFIPLVNEEYDFLVRKNRINKKGVRVFIETLKSHEFREELNRRAPGLVANSNTGHQISF